jgi:hypothetical protein
MAVGRRSAAAPRKTLPRLSGALVAGFEKAPGLPDKEVGTQTARKPTLEREHLPLD